MEHDKQNLLEAALNNPMVDMALLLAQAFGIIEFFIDYTIENILHPLEVHHDSCLN
jgi:hypothetical protein